MMVRLLRNGRGGSHVKKAGLFLMVIALLWCAADSSATMIGLSIETLTRGADLVVDATVQDVRSYWSADGKRILSAVTLAVNETVRGDAKLKLVTVEYEGGEVNGIRMSVSDIRHLVQGERVVAFLKAGSSAGREVAHVLVGQAQGVYTIGTDRVARKTGFSLVPGGEVADSDIDSSVLKSKVSHVQRGGNGR